MDWKITYELSYWYFLWHCNKIVYLDKNYHCDNCKEKIPNGIKIQLSLVSEIWRSYFNGRRWENELENK